MYMEPRFSLSVASVMRRCAWPSALRGREGMHVTPISVPVSRPASVVTHTITASSYHFFNDKLRGAAVHPNTKLYEDVSNMPLCWVSAEVTTRGGRCQQLQDMHRGARHALAQHLAHHLECQSRHA